MRLSKSLKIGGTLAFLGGVVWLSYKIILIRNDVADMSSRVSEHVEKHQKHLNSDWELFVSAWHDVVKNEFFEFPQGDRDASAFFAPLFDAYHPDKKRSEHESVIRRRHETILPDFDRFEEAIRDGNHDFIREKFKALPDSISTQNRDWFIQLNQYDFWAFENAIQFKSQTDLEYFSKGLFTSWSEIQSEFNVRTYLYLLDGESKQDFGARQQNVSKLAKLLISTEEPMGLIGAINVENYAARFPGYPRNPGKGQISNLDALGSD